ncbi:hypothetical protein EV03_1418 [Prochlorococcus marinus str. PAC1]|uniref:Uncharacterized protein n=1 Tax=Prochlorococcus marinus str. PAC1 TaxID=59924 RepID=A0A0A2C6E7_PROMR|nr:hypothetical protein EV03_1418 [Prochlorococcus marinus str. PAC1]
MVLEKYTHLPTISTFPFLNPVISDKLFLNFLEVFLLRILKF